MKHATGQRVITLPVNEQGEIFCSRCTNTASPFDADTANTWGFVTANGCIVGYVCPECRNSDEWRNVGADFVDVYVQLGMVAKVI